MPSAEQVSSIAFLVFGMTRPEIEPRSFGPLANTLPQSQWVGDRTTVCKLFVLDRNTWCYKTKDDLY